jgi:hypothetical protein
MLAGRESSPRPLSVRGEGRQRRRGQRAKGIAMFFVVFGLASIIFLTTALLVAALMLRGHWERMGGPDDRGSMR